MDCVPGPSHRPTGEASRPCNRPDDEAGPSNRPDNPPWGFAVEDTGPEPHEQQARMLQNPDFGIRMLGDRPDPDAGPEPTVTYEMCRDWMLPRYLDRAQRRQMQTVMEMFPDVCPRWLGERIRWNPDTEDVIYDMIANPASYERLVTVQQGRINAQRMTDAGDRAKFDPAKFLKLVPDAETRFTERNANVKPLKYTDLALTAMQNQFQNIRLDYMKKMFAKNNYHFYLTYKHMQKFAKQAAEGEKRTKPFMRKVRTEVIPWPQAIDDGFVSEYQYALFEDDAKQYKKEAEDRRQRDIAQARDNGELLECAVCLQECTPADVVSCTEDHPFCKDCVKKTLEPQVSAGITQLACLASDCNAFYAPNTLSPVLDPVVFNRLVINIQQKEMKGEEIDKLRECPLCQFAIVIEDADETEFRCANPDCLKVTCLQCKQLHHQPLPCNEVDKNETMLRLHVEEKVAQSLIKSCPSCHRPVVKTDGCDHITCPCRTEFCYACGGLWMGGATHKTCRIKAVDPVAAGIAAKAAFITTHPELQAIAERNDPTQLVDQQHPLGLGLRNAGMPFWHRRRRGRQVDPAQSKRAQRRVAQRATREQKARLRAWRRTQPPARRIRRTNRRSTVRPSSTTSSTSRTSTDPSDSDSSSSSDSSDSDD